ncbi:helix-turn-helix transcriptional regulator [Chitinophaga solisilvae]|uniref:helix-turn-helix transcriptional regulator n=1 Tax=Chitinophaga solisilvae TaxID=1233460 RepID=UPI0013689281|nr:AraC family transcriptional regulator [Chitinophaga solisilvae]
MGMMIKDDKAGWVDLGAIPSLLPQDLQAPLVKERREKFSLQFGDLDLIQITLPNIYIVYGDLQMKQHLLNMRTHDVPDMVELHFVLNGSGLVLEQISGTRYHFRELQHDLLYMPSFDGSLAYSGDTPYQFFEIHFTRRYFLELAQFANAPLRRFADHVAGGRQARISSDYTPISLAMHQCIREIMACKFAGGLKLLFLQSKAVEMLTLQAEAFDRIENSRSTVLHSSRDRDCIMQAREYLLQHMATPPSLTELAAITGTNVFKLKNGFKELFDTTVFGYLGEVKMSRAKEMLEEGMAIKEVSEILGYSSVQHFGTAFRKRFGITPGAVR